MGASSSIKLGFGRQEVTFSWVRPFVIGIDLALRCPRIFVSLDTRITTCISIPLIREVFRVHLVDQALE